MQSLRSRHLSSPKKYNDEKRNDKIPVRRRRTTHHFQPCGKSGRHSFRILPEAGPLRKDYRHASADRRRAGVFSDAPDA